jgi:hypothetical protein
VTALPGLERIRYNVLKSVLSLARRTFMIFRKNTIVCLLTLGWILAACSSSWIPAEAVATPAATYTLVPSVTDSLPLVQEQEPPTEIITVMTDLPAATATPTVTRQPTQTLTPLAPAEQLATFYAEATQTANPKGTPGKQVRPTNTRPPTRTPTLTPTPTITPTPTPPYSVLRISRPGMLSKVISPIRAEVFAMPGDDGRVQIDLMGEDGRYITRQLLDYPRYLGRHIGISPEIPFQINAMGETARLVVSNNDKFGRKIYLTSVDLVLLSMGENVLNPAGMGQEPYLIREPKPNAVVSGGVLKIVGLARPVNDRPILIELINEEGSTVGSKQITADPPGGDLSHTPFEVEIPYSITGITPVRLTLRQESSNRIPGTIALTSMQIILAP